MRAVLLALSVVASTAATSAPADQYFGTMKMSALRIRYEFMQLRPRYERHELLPEQAEHLADLAENAFYDWAKAYPRDSWLASTASLMASIYKELPGNAAHASAVRALKFVTTNFPHTSYAKSAAADLHRGPPVVADPAWAIAMRAHPSPLPSPSPSPSPNGSASPGAAASASPSPSPSPHAR